MGEVEFDVELNLDWAVSLRRLASAITQDPRNSPKIITIAECIYADAISAKAWNGISDMTYTAWAEMWYYILEALEEGAEIAWV